MGKISMEEARKMSLKIVEPIDKKIKEVNAEIKVLLTGYYHATIPQEVMKFFKKYPTWIATVVNVYLSGQGITKSYNGINIERSPAINGSMPTLDLSKEQASLYLKLCDKRDELKGKYEQTFKEIEATILSLSTHKRVAEQFPECVAFFSQAPKQNNQLMIQIAPVREKVKCLISDDKEKKCIDKL